MMRYRAIAGRRASAKREVTGQERRASAAITALGRLAAHQQRQFLARDPAQQFYEVLARVHLVFAGGDTDQKAAHYGLADVG
ncbi:MAG: hypothetical protein FJ143_07610 [Deltaproteobacteria bacterium]|nr:hypothetical protein [Deltaproteobacteria bacterium]